MNDMVNQRKQIFLAQKEVSYISQGELKIASYVNKAKMISNKFTTATGMLHVIAKSVNVPNAKW